MTNKPFVTEHEINKRKGTRLHSYLICVMMSSFDINWKFEFINVSLRVSLYDFAAITDVVFES